MSENGGAGAAGSEATTGAAPADVIRRITRQRTEANRELFERESERIARCCHAMAERFARGGRLLAVGATPAARSDARHVSVEFVHPVIVGKRALPALALTAEGGRAELQMRMVAEPDDIAIGFGLGDPGGEEVAAALAEAHGRGCLTIGFPPAIDEPGPSASVDWAFPAPGEDAAVRQEVVETLYHVLWELVHVFFDHRGLLEGRQARATHDTGASSFLYPFLSEDETDLEQVVADVRGSVLLKSEEIGTLREATLEANATTLIEAAESARARLEAGGKVLALGNGGSATDAMDLVADLRGGEDGRLTPRRALDLTEDSPIITAVANDVGVEEIFQRQLIAMGSAGDVLVAFSTSGGSENLIEALAEARRSGIETIAMVGYDGGRIAAEGLADHVVVTRSQNIPRIQEAQASAYHALRELIG